MVCRSCCALLTSMSFTGRVPSGLHSFLNAAVCLYCAAYNVLLKNRRGKKVLFPFYPALRYSVHLGKCSYCMIRRRIIFQFFSLLFSDRRASVNPFNSARCSLHDALTVPSKTLYNTEFIYLHILIIHYNDFINWFWHINRAYKLNVLTHRQDIVLAIGLWRWEKAMMWVDVKDEPCKTSEEPNVDCSH